MINSKAGNLNSDTLEVPSYIFTKEAYQKLKDYRAELLVKQKDVIRRLQIARDMGDLSENGAYKYAKFELGNTRRELGKVNKKIKYGKVGEVKSHYSMIEFGASFTLLNNGKETTYQLTDEFEADPFNNKVSWKSPIGKAVFNKKVGDVVTVVTPNGEVEFEIIGIGKS